MVDCTGLENRQRATVREFESHRLRHSIPEWKQRLAIAAISVGSRGFDPMILIARTDLCVVKAPEAMPPSL